MQKHFCSNARGMVKILNIGQRPMCTTTDFQYLTQTPIYEAFASKGVIFLHFTNDSTLTVSYE